MCCACCPRVITQQDSTIVYRTEIREIVKDTTIFVTLPPEKITNSTRDTTSCLTTSAAKSTASIRDGVLFHSLENRQDQIIPIQFHYTERAKLDEYKEVVKLERIVEVEKKLSWWQKALMWIGSLAIALIAIWLGIKIRKVLA